MVSAHLAAGTLFARATHAIPAFDGASGFVLLSGLVLGIVQRKRFQAHGLAAVQLKSVRRIGVIVVAQISLVALGIAVALVAQYEHRNVPPVLQMSIADVVAGALTLRLAPPSGSVLRLYVILLAVALVAYVLLAHGRWVVAVTGSLLLYAVGWVFSDLTSFHGYNTDALGANWACWQLMFVVALTVGWYWRSLHLAEKIQQHSPSVAFTTSVLIVIAFVGERLAPGFYLKTMLAPGQLINAFAVVLLLFVVAGWLLKVVPRWVFRPIEMIGTRSLDSYIIQAGVAVVTPSFLYFPTKSSIAVLAAVATLLICWAWAEWRRSPYWPATVKRAAASRIAAETTGDAGLADSQALS
jgi:hypothetical protein